MTEIGVTRGVAMILGGLLLGATVGCTEPSTASGAAVSPSIGIEDRAEDTAPESSGPDLYMIDPKTGEARVLLQVPGEQTDAELSPDGMRVVYESTTGGPSQVFVLKANGSTRQLTRARGGAHDPTWSPDGSEIAFASSPRRGGDTDIFVMDADGGHVRRLTGTASDDGHPDWSPDGSRIAFHGQYEGEPFDGGIILVTPVGSGAPRRITPMRVRYGAIEPAWSPDGRWIAYSRFDRVTMNGLVVRARVWLMRPDGADKHPADRRTSRDKLSGPSWSPDGRWVAFGDGAGDVRAINVGTGRRHSIYILRTTPSDDPQPTWSRRGILASLSPSFPSVETSAKYRWEPIARVELAKGAFFVNIRTGATTPLPRSITSIPGAGNYDVSPDGTMVLFDNASLWAPSDEPVERGLHQLWAASIDGSHVRQITHDPVGASQGSWSPDGTEITYLGGWARLCCWKSRADLIVLDVATGSTRRVTSGPARNLQSPVFSADGDSLLVTRGIKHYHDLVRTQPQSDLWTIPLGGGDPRLLLKDKGYASYSPDGSTIAFPQMVFWSEGNGGGSYSEFWLSDANGRDAQRIARRGGPGAWSPSGRWISFYQSYGAPHFPEWGGLHVLDATTGRSILLTASVADRRGRAGIAQDWVDDDTLIVMRGR